MTRYISSFRENSAEEIYELKKRKLFSAEELKKILDKRDDYYTRISQHMPLVSDYEHFINYEVQLLRLLRIRKKILGKTRVNTETKMVQRIHHLYQKMLKKYPHDINQWMKYAQYSVSEGSFHSLSQTFAKALKLNPHSIVLFSLSSFFELDHGKGIIFARSILQHGLRLNPSNARLYHDFFHLEMVHFSRGVVSRAVIPDYEVDELSQSDPKYNGKDRDRYFEEPIVPFVIYRNGVDEVKRETRLWRKTQESSFMSQSSTITGFINPATQNPITSLSFMNGFDIQSALDTSTLNADPNESEANKAEQSEASDLRKQSEQMLKEGYASNSDPYILFLQQILKTFVQIKRNLIAKLKDENSMLMENARNERISEKKKKKKGTNENDENSAESTGEKDGNEEEEEMEEEDEDEDEEDEISNTSPFHYLSRIVPLCTESMETKKRQILSDLCSAICDLVANACKADVLSMKGEEGNDDEDDDGKESFEEILKDSVLPSSIGDVSSIRAFLCSTEEKASSSSSSSSQAKAKTTNVSSSAVDISTLSNSLSFPLHFLSTLVKEHEWQPEKGWADQIEREVEKRLERKTAVVKNKKKKKDKKDSKKQKKAHFNKSNVSIETKQKRSRKEEDDDDVGSSSEESSSESSSSSISSSESDSDYSSNSDARQKPSIRSSASFDKFNHSSFHLFHFSRLIRMFLAKFFFLVHQVEKIETEQT